MVSYHWLTPGGQVSVVMMKMKKSEHLWRVLCTRACILQLLRKHKHVVPRRTISIHAPNNKNNKTTKHGDPLKTILSPYSGVFGKYYEVLCCSNDPTKLSGVNKILRSTVQKNDHDNGNMNNNLNPQ